MYTFSKRSRRRHKRVFFLLFVLVSVLISIIIFSGTSTGRGVAPIVLNQQGIRSTQPLISINASENILSVDLVVPVSPSDHWNLNDGKLNIYLNNLEPIETDSTWLDQHISIRQEDPWSIITLDKLNLPPIFRIINTLNGYRVEFKPSGLEGKKIAIDPGHGGHDPGAIGHILRLYEKDVTLAVSLELQRLLEEAGAEVFMTRTTDTLVDTSVQPGQHIRNDLWMRRNIVRDWHPDFFVSVHTNSWIDRNARGIETYFNQNSLNGSLSRVAARLVQNRLVTELQRNDRGIKNKSDAVLQVDNFPAVLVELLFISNPVEEQMMARPDFAARAAQAIFLGIEDYFNPQGGE